MEEIKFRVVYDGKAIGIERLTINGWAWMSYDLNPSKGERWTNGVFPECYGLIRNQFTGMKDVSGSEIYEGDLVKNSSVSGEVIFDDGAYSILVTKQFNKSYDIGAKPPLYDFDNEVIGNVYEHSDKLKNT